MNGGPPPKIFHIQIPGTLESYLIRKRVFAGVIKDLEIKLGYLGGS